MPRRHGTDGHHACGKAQDMRLEAKGIEKWYFRRRGDSNRFYAVRKCDLTLLPGTLTVLTGRSGSGKTTLLHMLSGILTPDDVTVLADDLDLYAMDDRSLSAFRNAHIGMLPQGGDVLPDLTVMENILLPHGIRLAQKGKDAEDPGGRALREHIAALMDQMEITDLQNVPAKELSGGERRRVCGIRALAGRPGLIFADEPTSDLDDTSMQLMLQSLRTAADEGAAVFVVTHDAEALEYADVQKKIDQGTVL